MPHDPGTFRAGERGAAIIAAAVIAAIVGSVTAAALLFGAIASARHSGALAERLAARYLAEAGYVIAREKLWENPTWCSPTVDVVTEEWGLVPVDVTMTNCGADLHHVISVTAKEPPPL